MKHLGGVVALVLTVAVSLVSCTGALYQARFQGRCNQDGFYYMDSNNFMVCSNGNAYRQSCAPGTRNSGSTRYRSGTSYPYTVFCDVNLVDLGFGAHSGYGQRNTYHPQPRPTYARPPAYPTVRRHQGRSLSSQDQGYGKSESLYSYQPKQYNSYQNTNSYSSPPSYGTSNQVSYSSPVSSNYGYHGNAGSGYGVQGYQQPQTSQNVRSVYSSPSNTRYSTGQPTGVAFHGNVQGARAHGTYVRY